MPFDFTRYDAKCAQMDAEQLQREWASIPHHKDKAQADYSDRSTTRG
jgi:hypothetical protein